MIQSVSVEELKKLSNVNLIDIRNVEKYNSRHILNAKNIISEKLIINPKEYLNISEKYYIYCQKGIQSRNVCIILQNKGYNVVNIIGGYEAWVLNE